MSLIRNRIRNRLPISWLIFLMCLVGGVGLAHAWRSAEFHFSDSLDRFVVDRGARLLAAVSSQRSPYQDGRAQAQKDLQKGVLKIKSLGRLTTAHISYAKLLKEQYAIEFVDYGCIGTADLSETIRGYNDVSEVEIQKRYGSGVLEESLQAGSWNLTEH